MDNLIGQRIGQYEVIALIGKGGMSSVYRARQGSVRDVALKVIDPGLVQNPDFGARFEREIGVTARPSHPHILKVFDYGQHQDIVYLVTELIIGGTLAERLRVSRLALDMMVSLFTQIGSALGYAHKQGIVHRDVKPNNRHYSE